jgi:hypothetical protein
MRVLREGATAIIASTLLIFAVVSTGVQARTIYDIEMDRHYVSAAKEQLANQYEVVKEKLDIARSENDAVAAAEYEMILDTISLIDRRVNIIAIGDQVEQTKEAFIEDQWSKFVAEKVIGVMGWGLGRIGFGKVTDAYIKGRNWPPGSNFVTYNPVTDQNVRIILGGRPELTVTRLSDEISDFGNITLEIFDNMRGEAAKNKELMSPYDAQKFISRQLEKIEDIRPLPSDIGVYIASSMIRQGINEGSHISNQEELDEFARDWACRKLTEMATDQSTSTSEGVDRSQALWAAVNMICGSSSDSSSVETPEEETAVEAVEAEEGSSEYTGSYEGLYEGELKVHKEGTGAKLSNSSAVLEVIGDRVFIAMDYSIYFEAILDGSCFATLTISYKGEGRLENPLSMDLVVQSYDIAVEGDGCGNYKENYDIGSSATLKGSFIDENNFEGRFLNLDVRFVK